MTETDFDPGAAETPQTPVFLVLERDLLIAADIVGSLQMMGPCRAIEVRDAAEARETLAIEPRITAAFLALHFEQVLEAGLDEQLRRRGAHVVLTVGDIAEPAPLARGWSVLLRPFTDQMVRDKAREGSLG